MQPIVYDVAVSIDGYISGPNGDISQFAQEGAVVDDYAARLKTYATAIMGRATYEFGYRFGMEPGQNPYPHMATVVFSASLDLPPSAEVTVQRTTATDVVEGIKRDSPGPIYLCGGGAFAGALLTMRQVDLLCLKRAPIVLGAGVPLFGDASASPRLKEIETRDYGDGYLFQRFELRR